MHNWRKRRNYRTRINTNETISYIIRVYRKDVVVSAKVYDAYAKGGWKIENTEYGLKRDRVLQDNNGRAVRDADGQTITLPEREVSLERLMADARTSPADELLPEEIVLRRMEISDLCQYLSILRENEWDLIYSLFYSNDGAGMSEREYSQLSGIPQRTINDRKAKIFDKLKNLLTE